MIETRSHENDWIELEVSIRCIRCRVVQSFQRAARSKPEELRSRSMLRRKQNRSFHLGGESQTDRQRTYKLHHVTKPLLRNNHEEHGLMHIQTISEKRKEQRNSNNKIDKPKYTPFGRFKECTSFVCFISFSRPPLLRFVFLLHSLLRLRKWCLRGDVWLWFTFEVERKDGDFSLSDRRKY